MKKILTILLVFLMTFNCTPMAFAAPVVLGASKNQKPIQYKKNARTITYAFVFDGPSSKNDEVMKQFKNAIIKTTAPDYKAGFSANNVFVGDWSEKGVATAANKAMNSNATMVVALGYLATKYYNSKPNKNKFVVTIDQYGLRDMGGDFFNPVQQSIKGILLFKRLIPFKKTVVLMNESFYKTRNDWNTMLKAKLPNIEYGVLPVNNSNIASVLQKISTSGYDAVVLTPLFNLSQENKIALINGLNAKKLPTFSTIGKDDVKDGVLMGSGAYDLDRKIAEATSFSIKGVLNGQKASPKPIQFYEDQIVYFNKDTADLIGYDPHLRLMNNSEIISNKKLPKYSLSTVFDTLDKQNLDIERKRLLVKAARRASVSAMLRYLPTFGVTLGYQQYNWDYADSAKLTMPEKTGIFQMGLEQVIYSPALVTNILVKKKMLDFTKQEQFLTEQNMGIDIALLYIEELILENMVEVQKQTVLQSRENLAIARVREKMGKCGQEEALRWASQLFMEEQEFLEMKASLKNVRVAMNKVLNKEQNERFRLEPLRATDPAFYTSEINVINYVSTPKNLEGFTQMLVNEAYRVAPELAKLKAAQKMKKYELSMYVQKFILPDAKLSLDYTSLMNRQFTGDTVLPAISVLPSPTGLVTLPKPDATNLRFGMFAQWKPFEGGTKIAEIARLKAEIQELERYEDEAKTQIEEEVRSVINKALAAYFSIEKDYKAMYAAGENYKRVQALYLKGDVSINQMVDAQRMYKTSSIRALNAQNVFFKELIWVQRAICAVNWTKATPQSKAFIQKIRTDLEEHKDIEFL